MHSATDPTEHRPTTFVFPTVPPAVPTPDPFHTRLDTDAATPADASPPFEVYIDGDGHFQVRIGDDDPTTTTTTTTPSAIKQVKFPSGHLEYTDTVTLYDGLPVFTD